MFYEPGIWVTIILICDSCLRFVLWEARWDAEWEHKQIVFILSSSPESGRSTMNPIERRKRSNWKTMQNFQIENFQSVSSAPEYNLSDWRTTRILLYYLSKQMILLFVKNLLKIWYHFIQFKRSNYIFCTN